VGTTLRPGGQLVRLGTGINGRSPGDGHGSNWSRHEITGSFRCCRTGGLTPGQSGESGSTNSSTSTPAHGSARTSWQGRTSPST